jgi:hypothetical protein
MYKKIVRNVIKFDTLQMNKVFGETIC